MPSRVLGTHHVPTVQALDAQLRTLLAYIDKLVGRRDLVANYRADLEDLLLRRLWLTLPQKNTATNKGVQNADPRNHHADRRPPTWD
jgi:hypothetical protein